MSNDFHELLLTQIEKYLGGLDNLDPKHMDFLMAVNAAYHSFEREHDMIEKSLNIQSDDLIRKTSQLKAIFKALPDIVLRIDHDGNILDYKSDATTSHYFLPRSLVGQNIQDLPDPDMFNKFKNALEHIKEEHKLITLEHTLKLKNKELYFEVRMQPFLQNEVIIIIRNVTARMSAIKELKESENRYALAAQGANDGLWDWDIGEDHLYFSTRFKSMLGYDDEDIEHTIEEWLSRVHPDDYEQFKQGVEDCKKGVNRGIDVECRMLHKKGDYIWVLIRGRSVRNELGVVVRMAGSQTDISDRKEREDQLKFDALHDKLTGLPNRTLFMDRLMVLCHRVQRYPNYQFAVVFVDADGFKGINDTYGHDAGDEVLKQISHILKGSVRDVDTVARFAGDEFTILLENITNEEQAMILVDRIQKHFQDPMKVLEHNIKVSLSIGVNLSSADHYDPQTLLKEADEAMYDAKKSGKAQSKIFEGSSS